MEDQLLEMLLSADDWMTAGDLAELGGWHPPHVGRALKNLGARVASRKSPHRENANGLPMTEYRHADLLTAKAMPTDKECCNAAKVVATTAGSEVAKLREQLEEAGQVIANIRAALRVGQQSSVVLAVENLVAELGHARIQIDALNEQLMQGEEAIDLQDAARGYLVCAPKRKPAKLMKAESAVARAKAAAKATGRGEVFALVPVGVATRKQIQAVEFRERAK